MGPASALLGNLEDVRSGVIRADGRDVSKAAMGELA